MKVETYKSTIKSWAVIHPFQDRKHFIIVSKCQNEEVKIEAPTFPPRMSPEELKIWVNGLGKALEFVVIFNEGGDQDEHGSTGNNNQADKKEA